MVSKCANPACAAPFRYLHEGRIFSIRADMPHRHDGADPRVERYWLCSTCADKMTLVMERGRVALRELASIAESTLKPQRAMPEVGLRHRTVA